MFCPNIGFRIQSNEVVNVGSAKVIIIAFSEFFLSSPPHNRTSSGVLESLKLLLASVSQPWL